MKKITLLFAAFFAFSLCQAQLDITFEETPDGPDVIVENFDDTGVDQFVSVSDQDGGAELHTTTVEAIPGGTIGNASARALKFEIGGANTFAFHYPLINIQGTALNTSNGNFITLKILSSASAVAGGETSFNFGLKVGAGAVVNYTTTYTPTSTTEWQTIGFDITGFASGVTRLDIGFDQTTRSNVVGEVTWIDDIKQVTTLSNDVILAKPLDIYPNPTKGELILSSPNRFKSITVHNLLGAEVKSMKAKASLDISDLASGVYILKTDTGLTKKIVKE